MEVETEDSESRPAVVLPFFFALYWVIIEGSGKSEDSSPFTDGSEVLGISARLEESSSGAMRADLLVAIFKICQNIDSENGRSVPVDGNRGFCGSEGLT